MQGTQIQSVIQEDPLEKEMANPIQYSCLGNTIDRGAWWAIVYECDITERQQTSSVIL